MSNRRWSRANRLELEIRVFRSTNEFQFERNSLVVTNNLHYEWATSRRIYEFLPSSATK